MKVQRIHGRYFSPAYGILAVFCAVGISHSSIVCADSYHDNQPVASHELGKSKDGDLNYCDDVCGRISKLDGASKTGVGSEAWCTMHGAGPGNAIFTGSGTGASAPDPTATSTGSCTVNGTIQSNTTSDVLGIAGDARTADGCATRALMLQACGWLQNSQLVNYCKAYTAVEGDPQSGTGPIAMDYLLAAADAAVAGGCWAGCITANPTALLACNIGSMSAGALEVFFTLEQGNGKVAKYISTIGGGLGIVAGVGGVLDTQASSTNNKVMACASASLFTIMAATRVADAVSMGDAGKDACQKVKDLAGSAGSSSPAGGGGSNSAGGGFAGGPGGGSGGMGASGSGGGSGSISGNGNNAALNPPGGLTTSTMPPGSAATDGGFDSKALKEVLPHMPNVPLSDLVNHAMKGQAAEMIASALPSGMDSGLASAITGMADAAQKNPGELAGLGLGIGGNYGGGGGGGGSKSSGGDSNPFGGLFGAGASKDGARGPSSEQYGKTPQNDIWHTGTTQNIFEIVSDKVSKVASRVIKK